MSTSQPKGMCLMLRIFCLMAMIALLFGVVVGVSEASFQTGLVAYVVSGFILLPLAGWWFTPQFRQADED